MLGAFAIGLLDLGVVDTSFGDGRLEIVQLDTLGYSAEILERMAMERQPGRDTLIPDKLDVLMAAPRQRHDKGPGLTQPPIFGVEHQTSVTEVDLGFLPWCGFDPDGGIDLRRIDAVQKAINGRE